MATELVDIPEGSPNPLQGLGRMAPWRQGLILVALAASVAIGVGAALWVRTPSYSILHASLSGKSAAEVVAALEQAGVPFRVEDGSGAILVPASRVREARLELAEQGLPRGADLGMEMLQQDQGFGTSQFRERARYQRAQEVELARTIGDIAAVSSARVHLALPRQSPFLRNRKKPSASVFIALHPGRRLAEEQVATVVHLVAAAIPNLEPDMVTVTDEKGRLLTVPGQDAGIGLSLRQFSYKKQLEADKLKKIERILTPIAGPDGFTAEVTAELDFTRTELTRESFNPDLPATRSRQVEEELTDGLAGSGGVPGALSNQPPEAARVPEEGAGAAPEGAPAASHEHARRRRKEIVNHELDRTVSHTRSPVGTLVRLSVAVVLDDLRVVGEDGTPTTRAWTPEELVRIESQVKAAIGFDVVRGDSFGLSNTRFVPPLVAEPLPDAPIWQQAWVLDAAKQVGVGVLALFLLLGVVRPLMRNLVNREIVEREQYQAAVQARLAAAGPAPEEESSRDSNPELLAALEGRNELDSHISTVRHMVREDPMRVANVMRNWVSEDG